MGHRWNFAKILDQLNTSDPKAIGFDIFFTEKDKQSPEEIIKSYGADTARLFMLSDSPPDRDLEWTEAGIEGSFRFINKIFKLTINPPLRPKHKLNRNEIKDLSLENLGLLRTSHRSV